MAVKTLNVAEKRTFKSGGKKSEMAEKNSRTGRRPISKHGHYATSHQTAAVNAGTMEFSKQLIICMDLAES